MNVTQAGVDPVYYMLITVRGVMRRLYFCALLCLAMSLSVQAASAQTGAIDPSTRLKEVLPADVAQRVLARIAGARARQLPAEALENRALKFAAKGVAPEDIERSVAEQAERMGATRNAIATGRGDVAHSDEIEAGAEAMRKGVDGPAVRLLAKTAPRERSLAVPLFVIGSLTDRGLPSDEALLRVLDRLEAHASDAELDRMPGEFSASQGKAYGRNKARPNRQGNAKPPGIPGNVGGRVKPETPKRTPREDG